MQIDLTQNEFKMLIGFLKEASDNLSNNVCNDYELKNTEENWALLEQAEALTNGLSVVDWREDEDYEPRPKVKDHPMLGCTDWVILDYLIHKLKAGAQ